MPTVHMLLHFHSAIDTIYWQYEQFIPKSFFKSIEIAIIVRQGLTNKKVHDYNYVLTEYFRNIGKAFWIWAPGIGFSIGNGV